jgi:hypothetical protein
VLEFPLSSTEPQLLVSASWRRKCANECDLCALLLEAIVCAFASRLGLFGPRILERGHVQSRPGKMGLLYTRDFGLEKDA